MTYCRGFGRAGTLQLVAARPPAGERGVNLHARSARPAPRPPPCRPSPETATSPAPGPTRVHRRPSLECRASARAVHGCARAPRHGVLGTAPPPGRVARRSSVDRHLVHRRLRLRGRVVRLPDDRGRLAHLPPQPRRRAQGPAVRIGHRHVRRHPWPLRAVVLHLRPAVRRVRHRGRSSSTSGRSSSGTCCSAAS